MAFVPWTGRRGWAGGGGGAQRMRSAVPAMGRSHGINMPGFAGRRSHSMELPQRRRLRPRLWSGPLVVHAATAPGPHEDVESKDDAESEGSPERVGGEGAGWRWINWVRDGLRDGTIAVNAEGGWLHNIAGEAFVVVPDGLEAFATFESVAAKTVKNRVVRLGRHGERSSPSGSANTLRAELADGRRVEGMVFPWRFRSGMVTARQRLTVLWGCDGGEHGPCGVRVHGGGSSTLSSGTGFDLSRRHSAPERVPRTRSCPARLQHRGAGMDHHAIGLQCPDPRRCSLTFYETHWRIPRFEVLDESCPPAEART